MFKGLDAQRMLALCGVGWLLFNYPLLGLLDRESRWFGLPVFPAALFLCWALLIGALAWLMERPQPPAAPTGPASSPTPDPSRAAPEPGQPG